jgi:hypothetical protein
VAIKAGKFVTLADTILVSRLQTTGPGNLGIPEEKIYEVGNQETVATLRDVPDLTWDMESWDMTTALEERLLGLTSSPVDGYEFDFNDSRPIDVVGLFKGGAFTSERGIGVPYLNLDSLSYRFAVGQSSSETATLRGDSIYYVPGTAYVQIEPEAGVGPYTFDNGPGIKTVESGDDLYAYCVTLVESDGTATRLFIGDDYTNTSTGITLTEAPPASSEIHIMYGSATAQALPQSIHPDVADVPAAVKGRDIDIYISDGAATPELVRWRGVQSVEINRRVTIERELELGNPHTVSSEYDVPEVSGSLTMHAADVEYLFDRIAQVTNVPTNETANALSSQPLEMEAVIRHPDTGVVLKTLYLEDARFQPPALPARANSTIEVNFPFTSDGGHLLVYKGERP